MLPLALSIPTPNFFGIGEFWSGLIIGLLILPAGFFIWFIWDEWDTHRLLSEDPPDSEPLTPDRPAGAGVLVCDFADQEMIGTIAQQKGVELSPKESERGREIESEGSGGVTKGPLLARFSRRTNEQERKRYEHREDYNVLLAALLDALERDGELQRNLSRRPDVSLGSDFVMDELAGMAERHSEAQTAREALATVTSRLMGEQKRREFESVAESNPFVLVEGKWTVTKVDGHTVLALAQLTPSAEVYSQADEDGVEMPDDLSLQVKVPDEGFSDQGRTRFETSARKAAVFGTAANYSNGTLVVSPIAVFGRYGSARDPEWWRGASSGPGWR